MAGTLVKSVMLKITASDGDTEAKLDQISAKAKELAAQHPDLQVKVDSAAASAKLAVLRTELKATANAADGDSTSLGSRLRGLGGAVASITGVGDAMTLASGDATMFQKVMAGASLATGLLEPLAAGAIVGVAGLGSGLAAAGVGGGIFGLALKGVITDVTTADKANVKLKGSMGEVQSSINHVETEYSRWIGQSAAGVESVLAPALALVPKLLSDATQFLGPVESALQDVILDVKQAMGSPFWTSTISEWAATSGPMIEDIAVAIGHVIHGVVGILDAFMPMSTSLGAGLDSITEKFAKWGETISSHTGFQSLISMAKTEAPMAIGVLKNLATVLLNVGKAMTGMDGVGNSKMLLQILQPLSGVLASLSKNQDLDRIALYLLAGADAGKKLKNTFSGIKDGIEGLDKGIGLLGKFGGAAEDAGRGAKIAAAATKVWTGIQAAFDVVMDANPIVLITIAIIALVAIVVLAYIHFKTFRDVVNDTGRAIRTGFMAAINGVKIAAVAVFDWFKSNWMLIAGIILLPFIGPIGIIVALVIKFRTQIESIFSAAMKFCENIITAGFNAVKSAFSAGLAFCQNVVTSGFNAVKSVVQSVMSWLGSFISTEISGVKATLNWFAQLGSLFRGWWNSGLSAVESVAGNLVSFVRGIPGKIVSALGNLGSLLFNAGKNVIQGLINGISSMIGSVGSAISNIAGEITSHLPFSPAKKGPLSGAGSPQISGAKIGQMLAAGIDSSNSTVAASAHRMAGAATITAGGGAAMSSAMGGMSLQVQSGGGSQFDQFMTTWIKKYVRVNYGGNVQTAFGH